ncbi:MAG: RNA polymerase sigma factor [Ruminococcaceae bacterium]|nr:RNA polymerase sigma factor [Oscillospiraceae bacterium]
MKTQERTKTMEDFKIVDLYWNRSENAIIQTKLKYEKMLCGISYSLLGSSEDAEECVNDTYLSAWNRMPTDRPIYLGAYLSKIIRALSISKFRSQHRQKRGGFENLCDELDDCIPDNCSIEEQYQNGRLTELINRFLEDLPEEKRVIFIRRYFCSDSVEQISSRMQISVSKVKVSLHRMREELREILEKEAML